MDTEALGSEEGAQGFGESKMVHHNPPRHATLARK